MWTKESLFELVKEKLSDYKFIAVSNREPYVHVYSGFNVVCQRPPSGLTAALDPVMQACGGTWIAHGSGDADRRVVDRSNKVSVPPEKPRYSLKRIWLSKEEENGYYNGVSNEAMWPLCHIVYTRPVFNEGDWNTYIKVNEIFAQSVIEEIGNEKAIVFIQDYHLALLPRLIKEQNSSVITAQFWHIPWPNPEVFRICPWQKEILEGLLSNDLLGFHIRYHCNNFMETVGKALEARIDYERSEVSHGGKKTAVRAFPISVDFEELSSAAQSPEVNKEMERIKHNLGLSDEIIGLGIDRFDYTKGIPDRLRAFEEFLAKNPEYHNKVVFIQAGVASRTRVASYQALNKDVDKMEEEINWKFSSDHWKPVVCMRENLPQLSLMALRRMADFCVVSSLHDGMNLVAKEYAAARFDEDGVLILSPFTGAANELTDSLLVNPYDTDIFAKSIKTAIEMPASEKKKRMRKMREIIRENNIYKWAADILSELLKFEFGE